MTSRTAAELGDPLASLLTADAAALQRAGEADLAAAQQALDAFKALPADAPFAEVATAFDAIGLAFDRSVQLAGLYFQVHPDGEVRERAAEIERRASRFATELSLDREAFERLAALDLDTAPDPVTRRVIEHALRDYRRAGVDRDEATRARVRAIQERLVELAQRFQRTIAEDLRTVEVSGGTAGLAGLPDDFVADHPPAADGTVTVTTDPTDYLAVMKYAEDRDLRRALFRAYNSRAAPDNLAVLDELLGLRHELAGLLGHPHWAAHATEDKMVRTAEAAWTFVRRVCDLAGARMEAEVAELLAEVQTDHPDEGRVRDHDRAFYAERLRRRRFDVDARALRPYFPFAAVRDGVLATAARLYGVEFRSADVAAWHPDVEVFDVLEEGERLGRLFLDVHPRPDKFKHAAMFHLIDGVDGPHGRRLPQACLVCNFPRPDAAAGRPALLEPDQVRTFFHEFGHLMHFLLAGRQPYLGVAGISTEWDFVEVPSQLFEEWGRDPGVLATFARHHATGAPIPAGLVARMNAANEYGKGIAARVQMFYAALSLSLHDRDPAGLDTTAQMLALREELLPFPHEEGTALQASFGHLEGYSALYYTYMWSLVLAKDCFSAFDGDVMAPGVARRYRERVLEPGGSRDAADLVADFLGRPSSFDAFEAWLAE